MTLNIQRHCLKAAVSDLPPEVYLRHPRLPMTPELWGGWVELSLEDDKHEKIRLPDEAEAEASLDDLGPVPQLHFNQAQLLWHAQHVKLGGCRWKKRRQGQSLSFFKTAATCAADLEQARLT